MADENLEKKMKKYYQTFYDKKQKDYYVPFTDRGLKAYNMLGEFMDSMSRYAFLVDIINYTVHELYFLEQKEQQKNSKDDREGLLEFNATLAILGVYEMIASDNVLNNKGKTMYGYANEKKNNHDGFFFYIKNFYDQTKKSEGIYDFVLDKVVVLDSSKRLEVDTSIEEEVKEEDDGWKEEWGDKPDQD